MNVIPYLLSNLGAHLESVREVTVRLSNIEGAAVAVDHVANVVHIDAAAPNRQEAIEAGLSMLLAQRSRHGPRHLHSVVTPHQDTA